MVDKKEALDERVHYLERTLRHDNPDGCGEEDEDPPEGKILNYILFHPY